MTLLLLVGLEPTTIQIHVHNESAGLAINKKWIEEIVDYNWGKIVWFTGN
jgi:hypothetical protein